MLGIVGLVIGGIWVAAAHVRRNQIVTETASGLLLIAARLDELLSPQDLVAITGGNNANTVGITSMAIAAGIVPQSWIANGIMRAPSGNSMSIGIGNNSASNPRIDIALTNVSRNLCIDLLYQIASRIPRQDYNLVGVWISQISTGFYVPFPIKLEDINTNCPDGWTLIFVFRV